MSNNDTSRERKFHLWGWGIFLVCAIFFIASAIEDDSILGLIGAIIFLIGCVTFIIPLVSRGKSK